MLFNSFSFLLFLGVVLTLHYVPGLRWSSRKVWLVVASYVFYAAWNPPFVLLLILSTFIDWHVARAIQVASSPRRRKQLLIVSLATNLGLLGYFKYGEFLLDNFVDLCAALGFEYQPPAVDIILPVGISFYTFQTLSYTIDVYRGDGKPWASFVDFALFVSFFPQLVAGPIVRAFEFLPQCVERRTATPRMFGWGLSLIVVGMFEKVFMADYLFAPISDRLFGGASYASTSDAGLGTLAFAGQIFCDFAGYSTCAIGVAMCLGFALPDNFRFPYAAVGFSDFWRRWHISLSSWLRDYLYISLGGNRHGSSRTYFNLAATMLLGGLWHGAAWTFVVWGGLHGLYLVGERLVRHVAARASYVAGAGTRVLAGITTFALVCFAWIFFRAPDFATAFDVCRTFVEVDPELRLLSANDATKVLAGMGALIAVHVYMRERSLEEAAGRAPWWLLCAALAVMLFAILTNGGGDRAFIYFQF